MSHSKRGGSRPGAGRKPLSAYQYCEEYAHCAHQVALLGGDDTHIAAVLDMPLKVIQGWKKQHPEFAQAIKNGQLKADLKVIQALFDSCTGHYVTETRQVVDADGNLRTTKVIESKIYIPANVGAIEFWLCNRQSERWSWSPPAEDRARESPAPVRNLH